MRANKTTIVNLNYVASYSKGLVYMIYLLDGTEIEISRRKKGEMLELLDIKKNRLAAKDRDGKKED
jgi:DNA-binding LytR/AlgR family response regulator